MTVCDEFTTQLPNRLGDTLHVINDTLTGVSLGRECTRKVHAGKAVTGVDLLQHSRVRSVGPNHARPLLQLPRGRQQVSGGAHLHHQSPQRRRRQVRAKVGVGLVRFRRVVWLPGAGKSET